MPFPAWIDPVTETREHNWMRNSFRNIDAETRPTRRAFIAGAGASLCLPFVAKPVLAAEPGRPLPIPPLADATSGVVNLKAITGNSAMLEGTGTPTWGFSQSYLGPTLRFRRGENARMSVSNGLDTQVTSHWHGMHVPAIHDGGPQLAINPGSRWDPELAVDQPAATLWYHSHVHGRTAEQVYGGLAGMIIVEDDHSADQGLPRDYGMDDIPLIIQDRAFTADGRFGYSKMGPSLMQGFRADTILVNGAITPVASVPSGLVRLRILNASNARIYHLRFSDDRVFHRVASDGGMLPKPVAETRLSIAPAERVEIVVDFADASNVTLLSGPDTNSPMAGMMGGMMGGMTSNSPPQSEIGRPGEFAVMTFAPNPGSKGKVQELPTQLKGSPVAEFEEPARTREFVLSMMGGGMGGGMRGGMGRGMMGMGGGMTINGESFDMNRIDVAMKRGETELWRIRSVEMAHPFHVHGTSFQVVSQNGQQMPFDTIGLKDVLLVQDTAEILVRVDHEATEAVPFLFHCHILEHEDAGMMGQFTVS